MAKHVIDYYLEAPNWLCFLICGNFFSQLNIEIAGDSSWIICNVCIVGNNLFFQWCMLLKCLQQLLFRILSGFFSDEFSPNSPCSIISMLMLQWHAYREIVFRSKNKVFCSSSNIAFDGPDWMLSFKLFRLSGSIGKFWVF
jgi:hypothetical protein